MSFSPFGPHEISVLIELTLGHLRYLFTDVPPQPNSPPDPVLNVDRQQLLTDLNPTNNGTGVPPFPYHSISKTVSGVRVFHGRLLSPLRYTSRTVSQSRTRVKLNQIEYRAFSFSFFLRSLKPLWCKHSCFKHDFSWV